MNIIEALKIAKKGKKIRRKNWYQFSIRNDFITYEFENGIAIYYDMVKNVGTAAIFTDSNILADDWEIIKD